VLARRITQGRHPAGNTTEHALKHSQQQLRITQGRHPAGNTTEQALKHSQQQLNASSIMMAAEAVQDGSEITTAVYNKRNKRQQEGAQHKTACTSAS
jgi:hypothetical protein